MKKQETSKWYDLEKIIIYLTLLFIIFAVFASEFKKNCNYNTECFQKAAERCNLAKLDVISHDNHYIYEIKGKEENNCLISVKLIELSPNSPTELTELFDQKEMICTLSQEELNINELIEAQGIDDRCSGPLKEAMYELIIKRMYGVIAKNFGPILTELDKVPI